MSGAYWGAVFSVRGERIGQGFIGESVSDIIVKEEAQRRIEEQQAQAQRIAEEEDDEDSDVFEAEPFSEDELVDRVVAGEPSPFHPPPIHPLPNESISFARHSPPPFNERSCTS